MKLNRRTVLLSSLALAACRSGPEILTFAGLTMGTTYSVVAVDHSGSLDRHEIEIAITGALNSVNAQMSNWDPNSEISRFNNAKSTDPISVSSQLSDLVATADSVHAKTNGQFDLTLGPLIELWGFGATGSVGHTPSDSAIKKALISSGQGSKLHAGPQTLQKSDPNTQIYVSGIGKGHGVDRVALALSDLGLKDFLVEIGGDLYTAGKNADGLDWQIGIERPDSSAQSLQQIVSLSELGMATSGDYRNYFEEGGMRYSHILDAQTGRPVTHSTNSATVLADNAMLADAWATAMLGLGRERGLEVAETHNLAVLFVEHDAKGNFVESRSRMFQALVS